MSSYPPTNPFADVNRASAVMAQVAPNLHRKPVDGSSPASPKDHRRRHRRKNSEQREKSNTMQEQTAAPASPGPKKPKKEAALDRIDRIDLMDVTGKFGSGLFHHPGPFDAANPNRNKNKHKAPVGAFGEDQAIVDPLYTDLPSPSHRRHHDVWGVHQDEAYTDYFRHHHQDGTHSADEDELQYGSPDCASNEVRPRAKSAGAPQQATLGRSKSLMARILAMRENPDSPPLPDPISDSDASPGYNGGTDYFMDAKGPNVTVRTSEGGLLRSNSLLARMRWKRDKESTITSPSTPTSPLSAAPFSAPTPQSLYRRSISFDKNKPLPVPIDADPSRRRSGPDTVFSSSVPLTSDHADDRRWNIEGRVHSNRNSNNSSGSDNKRESRGSKSSGQSNGQTSGATQPGDLSPPLGPAPTRKRSLLDRMRNVKLGRQ